jgi:hypothetical protein
MEIIKFNNFINEKKVQITVFDLVIDEKGEIAHDIDFPIKGNLDKLNKRIIGSDGKDYIAGIDRSGNLFSFLDKDDRGNILLDNQRVRVTGVRTRRNFWNTQENYNNLLPLLPTGWVNVKIDMEVIKKIKRYSTGVTKKRGVEGLKDRLEVLGRTDIQLRKRSSDTIRREMSAIMMLHYLNELKGHFDPSSAGFLFESYVAGLITGSRVKEDNSPVDIVDTNENRYQVKLLTYGDLKTNIIQEDGEYLEHYIVGFKFADKVKVFILNGIDEESEDYVGNFRVRPTRIGGVIQQGYGFSFSKFKEYERITNSFVYDLPLLNIRERIDKIATGLKNTLDGLYNNLSKFQFNVETILTGVDEKGVILDENQFIDIQNQSMSNLTNMREELDNLIGIISN